MVKKNRACACHGIQTSGATPSVFPLDLVFFYDYLVLFND